MNRFPAIALLLAALVTDATAQSSPPVPDSPIMLPAAKCEGCGVVRSVKRVEATPRITAEERASTSGLVGSVPLGGGKSEFGSSTDVRRELKPAAVSYEVVVRLDNGRFQLVRQDDAENLREGDKVRVDRGKVVLRDAVK